MSRGPRWTSTAAVTCCNQAFDPVGAMDDLRCEMVFNGRHARAFCHNPASDRLWVRLNARLTATQGFADPVPYAAAVATGYASIWVQTAENDYYINDDLPDLRQALHDYTARFAYVAAIGFSMGGFGALLLSRALRLQQAVLVSPQRRGFPARFPFRSSPEVEALAFQQGGDPALDGVLPGLRGVVLFDPISGRGRDRAYAGHLARIAPGLAPLPLPGGGHPATGALHDAKRFGQFQKAILQMPPDPAAIRAIHRSSRRTSPRYQAMLLTYLQQRAARVRP